MRKAKDVLTKEDLENFRNMLLLDFRSVISYEIQAVFKKDLQSEKKEWLRTKEVVKMLGVSTTTIQNLRISRTLKCTKVGGIVYYNIEDIQQLMRTGAKPDYRNNK